jgi:hypothetical protein
MEIDASLFEILTTLLNTLDPHTCILSHHPWRINFESFHIDHYSALSAYKCICRPVLSFLIVSYFPLRLNIDQESHEFLSSARMSYFDLALCHRG